MNLILAATMVICLIMSLYAHAEEPALDFHRLAPTPPMGWNSWDCFGTSVTEDETRANADYMAEKLAKFGWQYVVVDIQWYEPTAQGHDYVKGAPLVMDEFGRLLPATNKFPSAKDGKGFKPLADYIHAKGLKFGIHLLRGIPRQAVEKNTPILGTTYRAADIADKLNPCKWNPDMWGVDMSRPGAQEYYNSVFRLLAEWEVDFVKVDDLRDDRNSPAYRTSEVEAIRKAIDQCGRPMVLSTSPGETPLSVAEHVKNHANMWRISDDFWDDWKQLKSQFARCKNWAPHTGPGHWPDADMLALGAVRARTDGWTKFTRDEQYTHMSLWAICRSPLMFGGHLPKNDDFTLSLLTNEEVIAVNQNSTNGREHSSDDGLIVWVADIPGSNDKYVGCFNTRDCGGSSAEALPVRVKLVDLGFEGTCEVRDLWKREKIGEFEGEFAPEIRFHGAGLYRVSSK